MLRALVAALALLADAAHAQVGDASGESGGVREPLLLWTLPSDADRLVYGQWTWHLSENRTGSQNDRTFGVVYRGYFAGSFRTSYEERAYAIGTERHWVRLGSGAVRGALGYRFGIVYGYDGQLGWLAGALPILPIAQPMAYAKVGPFGAEVTYTWVVVSATLSVSLH